MEDTRSRIRWRCRRGIREMDILMARFVASGLDGLPDGRLATLERLLEESDLDLVGWLTGHGEPADEALADMVRYVRGHLGSRPGGDPA